ncbi:hypothetical protein DAEQUDRAFT_740752 [Daedalea quercina L-15889]|uniref:Homeobox domain-containing protein n=1 Tax=Daedalea quercina L-15889 TaxID=1314783 RepID=A0A165M797_9APHY|nr:hypothetical protein DAEQUDRAFT_740752 [Daedalea quercina L-15889]
MSIDETRFSAWTTLPGASASVSQPLVKPATKNVAKRITDEGYKLVDELYELTPYPSQAQKQDVYRRIVALPGCEHYKYDNINQKLAGMRKRDGISGSWAGQRQRQLTKNTHAVANPSTPEEILYPSLTQRPGITDALHILLKESPKPTRAEVRIWASRLGVFEDDIHTWIQHQQEIQQKELQKLVISSQLPTPGSSCSPEPVTPITPTVPPQSLLQNIPPVKIKAEVGSLSESKPASAFLSREQLQDLAKSVYVARTDSGVTPMSTEDAVKALDEHSERMQAFLRRYEKGEYAGLGLTPQLLDKAGTGMSVKSEPSVSRRI